MISLIAAMDENQLIGSDNRLPWHLPADLYRFRQLTLSKAVLMGRLTFESIGHALDKRLNFVLTHQHSYQAPGCLVVATLEEAYQQAKALDLELVVVGGSSVYQLALPLAKVFYLTLVHHRFSGQTYFPHWSQDEWEEIEHTKHKAHSRHPYPYTFSTWVRK